MNNDKYTIFDPNIILSIRDGGAGGIYVYLKSIGGTASYGHIKKHFSGKDRKMKRSINYLLKAGLISIIQIGPSGEILDDNLIKII